MTLSVVVYVSALALRATVLNISGKYYGPGSSVATKNRIAHSTGLGMCKIVASSQFSEGCSGSGQDRHHQPNVKSSKG